MFMDFGSFIAESSAAHVAFGGFIMLLLLHWREHLHHLVSMIRIPLTDPFRLSLQCFQHGGNAVPADEMVIGGLNGRA